MELFEVTKEKVAILRTYVTGLSTRQKILAASSLLLFVYALFSTIVLTLILTSGTVLGVLAAVSLTKQRNVFKWSEILPYLPHIAKERELIASDHKSGQPDELNNDEFLSRADEILTKLDTEFHEYVHLIMRDFILEWYRLLSDDDQFSHNIFLHVKAIIKEGKKRLSNVKQRELICNLLTELRSHIDTYRRVQSSRKRLVHRSSILGKSASRHTLVAFYETFTILHPAVQSNDSEKEYLTDLSNCLTMALLPRDVTNCNPLHILLRDFLISNVLQPVIDLISDPDFINEALILLLSDETLETRRQRAADRDHKENDNSVEANEQGGIQESNHELPAIGDEKPPSCPSIGEDFLMFNVGERGLGVGTEATTEIQSRCNEKIADKTAGEQQHSTNLPTPLSQPAGRRDSLKDKMDMSLLQSEAFPSLGSKLQPAPSTCTSSDALQEMTAVSHSLEMNVGFGPALGIGFSPTKNETFTFAKNKQERSGSEPPSEISSSRTGEGRSIELPDFAQDSPSPTGPSVSPDSHKKFTFTVPFTLLEQSQPLKVTTSPDTTDATSKLSTSSCDPEMMATSVTTTKREQPNNIVMPMMMLEPSIPITASLSSKIVVDSNEDTETTSQVESGDQNVEDGAAKPVLRHRRTASADSAIIPAASQLRSLDGKPISQSIDSVLDLDATLTSHTEGLRTCFSADCLTQGDDSRLLSEAYWEATGRQEEGEGEGEESLDSDSYSRTSSTEALTFLQYQTRGRSVSDEVALASKQVVGSEGQELKYQTPENRRLPGANELAQNENDGTVTAVTRPESQPKPLLRSKTEPAGLGASLPKRSRSSRGGEIPRAWASWQIRDLTMPTTNFIPDPNSKKTIVYFIIKYDLLKKSSQVTNEGNGSDYDQRESHVLKRQYREFVNLHSRLSSNPFLRNHLRGIQNVPKQSMLPRGKVTPLIEEHRKVSLEMYLQQLLRRQIIHNSREMAEFLAIDGDAHIEFVKKASNVPRIDKLLMRQVSGIVGTIKTVLPERQARTSALQPTTAHLIPPPASQQQQSHDQSRPIRRQQQQLVRQHEQQRSAEDIWDKDLNFIDETRTRLFGLDDMKESHLQRAMRLLLGQIQEELAEKVPLSPTSLDGEKVFLGPRSAADGSDSPDAGLDEGGEKEEEVNENVDLYEGVYGVIIEALYNQQTFLLDSNLQRALRVLISCLIDRWLETEIGLLFTEAQWAYYLSLLRELLWPDGVWSPTDREMKTNEEKARTKAEALHELTNNILSDVLGLVIGQEDLQEGMSLVLDSLQDADLNRHLVFTFLDYAMDQLVPEVSDPKFQASLAAMP